MKKVSSESELSKLKVSDRFVHGVFYICKYVD